MPHDIANVGARAAQEAAVRGDLGTRIEDVRVAAYRIPTDQPESDGTLAWDATTIVVVELDAGGRTGLGYTYAHAAAATLIHEKLADVARGHPAFAPNALHERLRDACRNLGRPGLASSAIAALDVAAWDLKARLLGLPLVDLLGRCRDSIAIYGSGGFTSYDDAELQAQLAGWVEQGIPRVKMKVGREPVRDLHRVRVARRAIGADTELFVDANGAYERREAASFAQGFHDEAEVRWLEEPVSSDDLEGLRFVREVAPPGLEIATGEYGYEPDDFRRWLAAQCCDVLQPDATRCQGVTGFLHAAALARAFHVPISAHTAPSVHAHLCCAIDHARHLEWFHDHVRIESMCFDGWLAPQDGALWPDCSRPGLGIELKRADLARYSTATANADENGR